MPRFSSHAPFPMLTAPLPSWKSPPPPHLAFRLPFVIRATQLCSDRPLPPPQLPAPEHHEAGPVDGLSFPVASSRALGWGNAEIPRRRVGELKVVGGWEQRPGRGGRARGAAGAGHSSPHSWRKEDPLWAPRKAQAMESLRAPDSPRLFTVPRKTSASLHTPKTQQPGSHQTTRKNKVRTASVIVVRLPEGLQQGRRETGLKKGGGGQTFRPGHRLALERGSSGTGMSAGLL